jgi:hypothetical protein
VFSPSFAFFRQALAGAGNLLFTGAGGPSLQNFADPANEPALNFRFCLPL